MHLLYMRNVVDDITLQTCGPKLQVATQLAGGVLSLFKSFTELQLPVEFKNCAYLCTREVDQHLRGLWTLPAACRTDSTRNLGANATLGGVRRISLQNTRLSKASSRARRLQILQSA
eukprot:8232843-Pyramimonas_sp.AAC.1